MLMEVFLSVRNHFVHLFFSLLEFAKRRLYYFSANDKKEINYTFLLCSVALI